MKTRSLFLFLVILFSAIPITPVQAELEFSQSPGNAFRMMYLSDAILTGEAENGETSQMHNLSAPALDDPAPDLDDKTKAAILQALKEWRNDLDKNCKVLTKQYRSEGKDCEADRIQAVCDQYREQINTEIGIYHDLRGDKRKAPTKIWHFLKRNGRNLWHKIGPTGRTFLRRLGPEVAQIVLSGGTMTSGALRKLVKQVARSIGRDKVQKIVFQGVERLLKGQIEILQKAGVDICADEETEESANGNGQTNCSSDTSWVDPFWDEVVVPALIEDNLNCQPQAFTEYYGCLVDHGYEGYCQEEAVIACEEIYLALPTNDSGGVVTVSPTIIHGGAEAVSSSFTFPSTGGAVSGQFSYKIIDNVFSCTTTISSTITSGTYDQATCSITGSAELINHFDGIACPGVCGPSTVDCPVTLQGDVPFEASLEDGVLFGFVGEQVSELGGFGFQASP